MANLPPARSIAKQAAAVEEWAVARAKPASHHLHEDAADRR